MPTSSPSNAGTNTTVWVVGILGLAVVVALLLLRGGANDEAPEGTPENALDVERELREGGMMINYFPQARGMDEAARGIGMTSQAIAGTDATVLLIHTYESPDARATSRDRVADWCPDCRYLISCGVTSVAFSARTPDMLETMRDEAVRSAGILDRDANRGGCEAEPLAEIPPAGEAVLP